jgi:hypothetical protein
MDRRVGRIHPSAAHKPAERSSGRVEPSPRAPEQPPGRASGSARLVAHAGAAGCTGGRGGAHDALVRPRAGDRRYRLATAAWAPGESAVSVRGALRALAVLVVGRPDATRPSHEIRAPRWCRASAMPRFNPRAQIFATGEWSVRPPGRWPWSFVGETSPLTRLAARGDLSPLRGARFQVRSGQADHQARPQGTALLGPRSATSDVCRA